MRLRRPFLVLSVFLLCAVAFAFNPGGHHRTLSAAFSSAHREPSADAVADLRRVEAFCAQLPDLSEELDAITQRKHVLTHPADWGWGAFSACWTPTSRQMVASQYYLHALTGAPSEAVRAAARRMVGQLALEVTAAPTREEKLQLSCQRGFAEHLFGDTFSHTRLDADGVLYDTGFGHARDMDTPDRMLRRPAAWGSWLVEMKAAIEPAADISPILALAQGVNTADGWGEDELVRKLLGYATPDDYWEPYSTPLDHWTDAPTRSGVPLLGRLVDLYADHIISLPCQAQIERGPADRDGGTGVGAFLHEPLNCAQVWKGFLQRAEGEFADAGLRPPCDVDVPHNRLEDGQ